MQQVVRVQQHDHLLVPLGESDDETRGRRRMDGRVRRAGFHLWRNFDVLRGDTSDILNPAHQDPADAVIPIENHNGVGERAGNGTATKADIQVHHGKNRAAKIGDTAYRGVHLLHWCEFNDWNNLAHPKSRDTV